MQRPERTVADAGVSDGSELALALAPEITRCRRGSWILIWIASPDASGLTALAPIARFARAGGETS